MLIIKAPISLACRTDMTVSSELFSARIKGNYQSMTAPITSEDLLHMVTTPPEIYFGEENESNILNQSMFTLNQETKVELINQLANRILLSNQENFTYQDQVFITNLLHKLGISDTNLFMKQVSEIRQETNNTANLIDLYWEHLEELKQMVVDYNSQSETRTTVEETQETLSPLYLHESIMNRLQTGAIYQILHNFHENNGIFPQQITNQELLLSEQHRVTQNIFLNKLENTVRGKNQPLIYRHENFYEDNLSQEVNLSEEQMTNHLTAAVLLQMIDNVYQAREDRQRAKQSLWYHFESAMYQTAENTMKRMSSLMTSNYRITSGMGTPIEQVNESYQQEITMINRLLEMQEMIEEKSENQILTQEFISQSHTKNQEMLQIQHGKEEIHQTLQNLELENLQIQNQNSNIQEENYEELELQIQEINRINVENRNRYLQNLQKLKEQETNAPRENLADRMRKESLKALESPEEVLMTYREEAVSSEAKKQGQTKQILEALPPESRKVYELLEQYTKTPERMQEKGFIIKNDMGQLMHDIEEVKRINSSEELIEYHDDSVIKEVTENIIEKWHEKPVRPEKKEGQSKQENPKVPLIHKQVETPLEDEVVEQLLEQNRILKNTTQNTEEIVENRQNTTTTIVNQTSQKVVQQTEDIAELIERGVQRQIGDISEQVMGRIEKKLLNERKRRGF